MIKLHNLPGKYLFYCDENFPESSAIFLRSKKFNVVLAKKLNKDGLSDERQIKVAASLGRILLTMDFDFSDMCGECKKMKTGIVLLHSNNPLDTNKLLARLIKELIKKDIQLLHHITVVSFKEVKQVC